MNHKNNIYSNILMESFWSLIHQGKNHHVYLKSGLSARILCFTQRPILRAEQFTFGGPHLLWIIFLRLFSIVREIWFLDKEMMVTYVGSSTQHCMYFIWPCCMYLYFWYPELQFSVTDIKSTICFVPHHVPNVKNC